MQKIDIETDDGWVLSGLLFEPDGPIRDVVVLSGATGVPRNFYRHFAKWCAKEHDTVCIIYDYRDFGASKVNDIAVSPVSMSDWAISDQCAAIKFALKSYPSHKITLVGHSLGGMFLQYQSNFFKGKIKRAITVASGSGYWLQHPFYYIPVVTVFWWVLGPIATKILGFMPGKTLGFGSDLPANVYWQWRRWCLSKRFYDVDRPHHFAMSNSKIDFPVSMFAFSDDVMIPLGAVQFLHRFYDHKDSEVTHLTPQQFGLKKIGHIPAFAARNLKVWSTFFQS